MILPFRHNRDFVVRSEFNTLWDQRNEPSFCVALVGLGGVGYAISRPIFQSCLELIGGQQIAHRYRIRLSLASREAEHLGVLDPCWQYGKIRAELSTGG